MRTQEGKSLEERQLIQIAHHAVQLASDHQASDVVLLDIRAMANFADFFVLMTAESRRQMNALAEELNQGLAQRGVALRHQEGSAESGWILLDFGALIVHIFAPEVREFYGLEALWSQALPLLRIQ